jgi:hypothetical protein
MRRYYPIYPRRDTFMQVPLTPLCPFSSLEHCLVRAGDLSALPQLLEELSLDPRCEVRRRVALNPITPTDILKKLARDPDSAVRLYVRVRLDAKSWRKALKATR